MKIVKRQYFKRVKGFTLIEGIVSVAILAIVAVSILAMLPQAYNVTFLMGRKTKASNQAQEIIEIFYNNPVDEFFNISVGDKNAYEWIRLDSSTPIHSIAPTSENNKFFYIDVISGDDSPNYGIDMYKITVIVYYQNLTKSLIMYAMTPM